jgi:hypothetical protein
LNFHFHKHLLQKGGADRVKYAISFLDTWHNHTDARLLYGVRCPES